MTLHVELDRLAGLGPALQGLADEAARSGPSAPFWLVLDNEPAVLEATNIAHNVVDQALLTAVKERLSETGEIMVNLAYQYGVADEYLTLANQWGVPAEPQVTLETAIATYTNATGDWDVPEVPE